MKHEAEQFPLEIPAEPTRAPFTLQIEEAPAAPIRGEQTELALPKQPPASNLGEWLARLSPAARARAQARRALPIGARGRDPVTGCAFDL